MNSTTSPLTELSKERIITFYEEFYGARDYISMFFANIDNISIFDHLHFGYSFSSLLHEVHRTEDYKKFVRKYNEVTEREFSGLIESVNNLFSQISLRINFLAIMRKPNFLIEDKTDIFNGNEFRYEKTLEDNIFETLTLWDESWKVSRQKDVGYGKCDIVLERNNEKSAIELKKGKAERKDVYQAIEYSKGSSGYKPILVARSFGDDVIDLAKEYDLACYEYVIGTVRGLDVPGTFYLFPAYGLASQTEVDYLFQEVIECDGFLINYDIPSSSVAHELANKELDKFKIGVDSFNEYLKSAARSNICPCCKTVLQKDDDVKAKSQN